MLKRSESVNSGMNKYKFIVSHKTKLYCLDKKSRNMLAADKG